jgi:hypothetical protein
MNMLCAADPETLSDIVMSDSTTLPAHLLSAADPETLSDIVTSVLYASCRSMLFQSEHPHRPTHCCGEKSGPGAHAGAFSKKFLDGAADTGYVPDVHCVY